MDWCATKLCLNVALLSPSLSHEWQSVYDKTGCSSRFSIFMFFDDATVSWHCWKVSKSSRAHKVVQACVSAQKDFCEAGRQRRLKWKPNFFYFIFHFHFIFVIFWWDEIKDELARTPATNGRQEQCKGRKSFLLFKIGDDKKLFKQIKYSSLFRIHIYILIIKWVNTLNCWKLNK